MARATAAARPMPREPPATMATLSERARSMGGVSHQGSDVSMTPAAADGEREGGDCGDGGQRDGE